MWRARPDVLAAALWAALTTLLVRHRLRRVGTQIARPWAPKLGHGADRGVWAFLTRLSPNCLERAVVAQAWLARHGAAPDIVIGVPFSGIGLEPAHAWLDGAEPSAIKSHVEIQRLAAAR
ncbi:MAG TPA: lasso peptide biosynthesis protein [Jatrophihabitantaceae bacterium]|jgi:hypothetical protein|nr:lasso peptide biosynthesis protein [Jatrophihabitantaceae bacterium]